MSDPERPKIRQYLVADQVRGDPAHFEIRDLIRLSPAVLKISALDLEILKRLDGTRVIGEIQEQLKPLIGGALVPDAYFSQLLAALDECLFIESPAWKALIGNPVRPPSCIGCYEEDPQALAEQMEGLYRHKKGPGIPSGLATDHRLDAILAPHIDYARGGFNFAHAFRRVYERTNARLFVIIGTSHYSPNRFTLTRKSFRTPLGDAPVDGAFCDRLEAVYGDGLYDDELRAHFPEHSIELEVVFLQHLLGPTRPFRIVPLVVGAMEDLLQPAGQGTPGDIGRMVRALRAARDAAGEPVCFVISGDLAHIGPKFGDEGPLTAEFLAHSQKQDQRLLRAVAQGDMDDYTVILAAEGDARRICGFPPTWLTLQVLGPCTGKLLRYDQHVHPHGSESVSFAAMAFTARA